MQEVFLKIIEKLEELQNYACFPTEWVNEEQSKIHSYYANKLTEILKLTEQHNNGWISCSSGVKPRANGWYLVTNHLGVVQEQRWSANHWEKLRDDAVLAWRELPYPYQPKGDRVNCKNRHENGNCLAVGGFCTSVSDKHCQYQPKGE